MNGKRTFRGLSAGVLALGLVWGIAATSAQDMVPPKDADGSKNDNAALDEKINRLVEGLRSDSPTLRGEAQRELDALGPEALDALQRHAARAKERKDADLELRLRRRIDDLSPKVPNDAPQGKEHPDGAPDENDGAEDESGFHFRIRPARPFAGSFSSRQESFDGTTRKIVDTRDGVTRTFTRNGDGPIKVEVKKGETVETFEFASPDEMKSKNPELYGVWDSEAQGFHFRFEERPLAPRGEDNSDLEEFLEQLRKRFGERGGDGDDARKRLEDARRRMDELRKRLEQDMERHRKLFDELFERGGLPPGFPRFPDPFGAGTPDDDSLEPGESQPAPDAREPKPRKAVPPKNDEKEEDF